MCARHLVFVALVVALAHARRPHVGESLAHHAAHELEGKTKPINLKALFGSCEQLETATKIMSGLPVKLTSAYSPLRAERQFQLGLRTSLSADLLAFALCTGNLEGFLILRDLVEAMENADVKNDSYKAAVARLKKRNLAALKLPDDTLSLIRTDLTSDAPDRATLESIFSQANWDTTESLRSRPVGILNDWAKTHKRRKKAVLFTADNEYHKLATADKYLNTNLLGTGIPLSGRLAEFLNTNPQVQVKEHKYFDKLKICQGCDLSDAGLAVFRKSPLFPDFVASAEHIDPGTRESIVLALSHGSLFDIKPANKKLPVKHGLDPQAAKQLQTAFEKWKKKLSSRWYTLEGTITRL